MATVDDVKAAVAIEAVVAEYVPSLKRLGATYKACCPFHNEKSPSFVVSPERQSFKCFGCGASGDVIEFIQKIENLDFRSALRRLADRVGMTIDTDTTATTDSQAEPLYAVNLAAVLFFQGMLRSPVGAQALAYVRGRNLTDATIDRFALGYAPPGWDNLLRYLAPRGYDVPTLLSAGLVTAREGAGQYDRFRDRLIFPIRDTKGRVVGFGGRALDDSVPKYLNSPQTHVFDKGSLFYCQDVAGEQARKTGRLVIVEGYMDALAAHQTGFANVVASMGTALTDKQMRRLQRSGRTVVLALDADAAGHRAVERIIQLAYQTVERELVPLHTTRTPTERGQARFARQADVRLQVALLPDGQDPDELILSEPSAWERLIETALPIVEFYFALVTRSLDHSLDYKREATDRLVPVLAEITDPLERDHYTARLAQLLQVSDQSIAGQVARYRQQLQAPRSGSDVARGQATAAPPTPTMRRPVLSRADALTVAQRTVVSLLIRYPRLIPTSIDQLALRTVEEPRLKQLTEQLVEHASPITDDPVTFLARLDENVRALAADVLLETASLPDLDELPLQRDLERLFQRWDEEVIRGRLGHYERALRDASKESAPLLREEVDALTREMRTVFEQEAVG